MTSPGTLNSKAKDHAADALRRRSHDATADKGRRQSPTSRLMAEDKHLNVSGRKKLIGTTGDLYRNFAPAAWAIRKHLDYTSTSSFQVRTGDDVLNRRIEVFLAVAVAVAWWSRRVTMREPTGERLRSMPATGRRLRASSSRLPARRCRLGP